MDFTIQIPKQILFGEGTIKEVPQIANEFAAKSGLLITDPILSEIGLTKKVLEPLKEAGMKIDLFDQVEPEPSLQSAEQVVQIARKSTYDIVIGLGGGSSLDMTKLASISITNPEPITDFVGVKKVRKPGIPKILIPTTSGTGSEITMNSIISNKQEHLKMGIVSPHIIADVAIIDPLLTLSMPPKVTASTGLDALTHAIESLMSIDLNPFCEQLAIKAVRLIFQSLPKAYNNGNDRTARNEMSLASMLAGMSLAISGVCAGHAAAYTFTVTVPHGVGCALTLPYVMELNAASCLLKLVAISKAAQEYETGESNEKNAYNAVQAVRNLMKKVDIPLSLKQIGIKKTDIDSMAENMLTIKRLLAHNPKKLTIEDTKPLFNRMFEGTALPLSNYK
ncbi:iron-containing alcohol dehydrogenase [Candidatus Bathyarchaeota archaeon]|nr:iron-containing alcohol dehydrogenase [Candidatus Bathyarchaeota archaeon]